MFFNTHTHTHIHTHTCMHTHTHTHTHFMVPMSRLWLFPLCVYVFLFFFGCPTKNSQARDQIQAAAAAYTAPVVTLGPLTHCAMLGIEPASWCCRDNTDPIVQWWEFQDFTFNDKCTLPIISSTFFPKDTSLNCNSLFNSASLKTAIFLFSQIVSLTQIKGTPKPN